MTATPASIDVVCPHCGKHGADPQTGRCVSCGKRVVSPDLYSDLSHPVLNGHVGESRHSPSAAYRANHSIPPAAPPAESPPPPPEPSNQQAAEPSRPGVPSAAWLAETCDLRDGIRAAAERTDAEAKASTAEAKRLRGIVDELSYLLEQFGTKASA